MNNRTMEPLNEKSQIAQQYGLLPTDARQQRGLELTEKASLRSCPFPIAKEAKKQKKKQKKNA